MLALTLTNIALFILGVISTRRISDILVYEKIFLPLRQWLGISRTPDLVVVARYEKLGSIRYFLGNLMSCVSCTSVWVAIVLVILHVIAPTFTTLVCVAMTLSYLSLKL